MLAKRLSGHSQDERGRGEDEDPRGRSGRGVRDGFVLRDDGERRPGMERFYGALLRISDRMEINGQHGSRRFRRGGTHGGILLRR